MASPKPLTGSLRIFEPAVIEGIGKYLVKRAYAERFPSFAFHLTCPKVPLFVRDTDDMGYGMLPGEHEFPHAPHEVVAFGIRADISLSFFLLLVVHVPERGNRRTPPFFRFGTQTSFDIPAEVVDVFLGHAESM